MLKYRLLLHVDAYRYRVGVNYGQLPANRSPFGQSSY